MTKIDIIQLAKVLNLSKSTVSRAFMGSSDIKPETRARILKVAEELNYRPNHYASNLRKQKSKIIAVVVPELGNNFFSQIIRGVERVAKAKDYHVLVYTTDGDIQKEKDFLNSISNGRVDGVLMSVSGAAGDSAHLKNIDVNRLPIVLFDRTYADVNLPKVVTDDYESSYTATQHLLENGCKRIAYLVVNKEHSIGKTRLQGYQDALKKNGLPVLDELIVDCAHAYAENATRMESLFREVKPDGVLASVERLAFSTYYVCQALNIRIPEDLKVVAYSSLEIVQLLNPSLTTITQPAEAVGEAAATLLLDRLIAGEEPEEPQHVILPSNLLIRKSSALEA
ncbi:LacI family DNA-binding transcriptional regulator [Sphingobacterium sp. MYb382]|uniref:LacI family DNA-binding transcriptional regulator n=1 Tax=Sphingobacterium sp. MYb382 TaxID=2745278 RepID=UPI0030AC93FA